MEDDGRARRGVFHLPSAAHQLLDDLNNDLIGFGTILSLLRKGRLSEMRSHMQRNRLLFIPSKM